MRNRFFGIAQMPLASNLIARCTSVLSAGIRRLMRGNNLHDGMPQACAIPNRFWYRVQARSASCVALILKL